MMEETAIKSADQILEELFSSLGSTTDTTLLVSSQSDLTNAVKIEKAAEMEVIDDESRTRGKKSKKKKKKQKKEEKKLKRKKSKREKSVTKVEGEDIRSKDKTISKEKKRKVEKSTIVEEGKEAKKIKKSEQNQFDAAAKVKKADDSVKDKETIEKNGKVANKDESSNSKETIAEGKPQSPATPRREAKTPCRASSKTETSRRSRSTSHRRNGGEMRSTSHSLMDKERSKSPSLLKKKSSRSRSRSLIKNKRSRSRSLTKKRRLRSRSLSKRKRSRSTSLSKKKRSRSRSLTRKKGSRSRSLIKKKHPRSRSRSPAKKNRSRSRSLVKKKRSRSRSLTKKKRSRSRSRSLTKKRRSRSRSSAKKKRSRSRSRSQTKKRRSRSRSSAQKKRSRSRSRSLTKKKRSRSRSLNKRKRSRSRSLTKRKRSRSRSLTRKKRSRSRSRSLTKKKRSRSRSLTKKKRTRSRSQSLTKKQRSRSRSPTKKSSRSRSRSRSLTKKRPSRSRSFSKRRRSRSRSLTRKHQSPSQSLGKKRRSRSRSATKKRPSVSPSKHRSNELNRSPSFRSRSPHIDKAQLLEIARTNLKRMQESGATLVAAPPVEDARVRVSKSSGKTVEELTDYCKHLQQRESADEAEHSSTPFHPFQIKARSDSIVMNIRNAIPLPVRKPEERIIGQSQLKQQFPVSSGQQHLELEWIPVTPSPAINTKEANSKTKDKGTKVNLAAVAPTPRQPVASIPLPSTPAIDIGVAVTKRLSSIKKLQDNQEDAQARLELEEADLMTQTWACLHHTNPMTGEPLPELINWSGAPQAWARKDQFTNAVPIAGGVGMKLLQKMGWVPGEGLGRNSEGTLEPLAMDIKLDKKGLVSKEEVTPKSNSVKFIQSFQGKHPVSTLHELCTKKRWEPPIFEQVADIGPDHLKHFLFKVIVNKVEYRPCVASTTKKEAKAQSAALCLEALGITSTTNSDQHWQ